MHDGTNQDLDELSNEIYETLNDADMEKEISDESAAFEEEI